MLLQGDGRCRDQRGWCSGGAGAWRLGVSGAGTSTGELLAYLAGEDDPFVELLTRGSGIEADRYRLRLPEQVSLIRGGRAAAVGAPGPRPHAGHRGGRAADLPGTRRAGMRGRRTGRPLGAGPLHRLQQAPGRAGRARAGPARPAGGGVEARIGLYRAERRAWWTWLAGRLRLPRLAGRLGAVGSGPVPEPPAPPPHPPEPAPAPAPAPGGPPPDQEPPEEDGETLLDRVARPRAGRPIPRNAAPPQVRSPPARRWEGTSRAQVREARPSTAPSRPLTSRRSWLCGLLSAFSLVGGCLHVPCQAVSTIGAVSHTSVSGDAPMDCQAAGTRSFLWWGERYQGAVDLPQDVARGSG